MSRTLPFWGSDHGQASPILSAGLPAVEFRTFPCLLTIAVRTQLEEAAPHLPAVASVVWGRPDSTDRTWRLRREPCDRLL